MQNTPRESKGRVAIGNADLIYNKAYHLGQPGVHAYMT